MPTPNRQPSTPLLVALTTVAVCMIAATALILITLDKSELPEGWLGLFIGFGGAIITALVTLGKVDKMGRQVDELYNGRGDAKTRAAVADVMKDEHLDPDAADQIAADRARRDVH